MDLQRSGAGDLLRDRDDLPFETAPGLLLALAEIKCLAMALSDFAAGAVRHALVSQISPGRRFTRAWKHCSMCGRGALEIGCSRPGSPE